MDSPVKGTIARLRGNDKTMIDTHCHLTEERLMADIEGVLERAKENGVEKIIVPGTSVEDSMKVIGLTEKYEEVYGVVGVHPEEIAHCTFDIAHLKRLVAGNKKIVGIGEIGMENYERTQGIENSRKMANLEIQVEIFRMQLELAVEMNKPVVIHNREANKEIMEVMNSMRVLPRGQFHCWAGDEEMLSWALDKGFYVSFCGNITFKSASNLREMVLKVPLNRLLLETDAPYLSPEPKRGSLNEPANVKITAGYIAKLLDVSITELDRITTENAKCLFFDTL